MNKNYLDDYLSDNDPLNDPDIVHKLSVVTTHYVFRNGPVEDMHAQGRLSDNNMMRLNIFIVNRLAYIFSLILDEDKMKVIESYCIFENIEFKLADTIIEYCFIDGIEKNKIETEKLDDNDIEVLVEYMKSKLEVTLRLILNRDIKMIKNYLLMGLLFGNNWDYAIPDSIEFQSFLNILKNYK
jgi:hypothetical protein